MAAALLAGAVALAGPAAAIEDPRRPTAEVTHGPSCGPGVVRVAVTNGTEAHHLALVFDDAEEQGSVDLGKGEQAELTSSDVDWGQTVDVSLQVTDVDGTAEQPIRFGTYTRPSAEDCAAITPTTPATSPAPSTAEPSAPTSTGTTDPAPPTSASPVPTPPASPRPTTAVPAPTTPRSTPPSSTSSSADGGPGAAPSSSGTPDGSPGNGGGDAGGSGQAGSASAASVSPGGVVTVRATGFTAGESVTVSLLGADAPLTTVTAGPDGSVEAVVQIPRDAALGSTTVQLVGAASDAVAGLQLQVAARALPVAAQATSMPVLAAGFGLIGAAAVLGLVAARRSRGHHTATR